MKNTQTLFGTKKFLQRKYLHWYLLAFILLLAIFFRFYDISKASEKQLIKAGWQKDTFKRIYESTARWWFREQP